MLNITRLVNRLENIRRSFEHRDWPVAVKMIIKHRWPIFMLFVCIGMVVMNVSNLSPFGVLCLMLFISALAWLAWQWELMQLSIVITVLLYFVVLLTHSSDVFTSLLIPLIAILLLASLFAAALLDFRKTPLKYTHVSYVGWSVIICGSLLLMLRGAVKPATELNYAALPLASFEEFLLWAVVVMMFLYQMFQRSHARVQGEYLALLPVVMTGIYSMSLLHAPEMQQLSLPESILEHGLLLIHVPAMLIAVALLLNATGFALLRLLSDSAWLRAKQNVDILETVQTGLDDYLYRQLKLAIMLLGAGLLSGMFWSDIAWGHYWQAEPKMFMSLSLWLYYLAGLHFRLQRGMQMQAFAWWCLAGLPLIFMCVFGTNWWSQGLHSFSGL